ncbi:MAG: baseplate J/gp47 family protein [Halanaerobiaceae bacterium]
MKVRSYRVFYIEHEAGIKELIDLLKSSSAARMALVIKNGQLILNSSANLSLLMEYKKKLKKDIVIINPDRIFAEKVNKAGFKMYLKLDDLAKDLAVQNSNNNNIKNLKGNTEKEKEKEQGKKAKDNSNFRNHNKIEENKKGHNSFISRIVSVFLILLIIAMSYLYFIYPTASVEIYPRANETSYEFGIKASNQISNIDWEKMILPLHMTEVRISTEKEVQTTGVRLIGDKKASTSVRFINERKSSVDIPAGTIIKSEAGTKFRTVEDIVVPGLDVDYLMDVPVGMKAGQKEVKVEALTAGSQGNLSFGEIKILEKPLENIYVINPEASRGGSDKKISYLSEEDIERAKILLKEDLKSKLLTKVYQELGGNYRVIEEEISFSDPEYFHDYEIGEETDTFTIKGELLASAYLLKNNELDRVATNIFKEKISDTQELMSSGISINSLRLEETGENMYNVNIEASAPVLAKIDTSSIARNLSGMEVDMAEQYLEEIEYLDYYNIESESEILPKISFAINVTIGDNEAHRVINLKE